MYGISYTNTRNLPGWANQLHLDHPLGYAYETPTHFVHFWGNNNGFYNIQVGLTTIEGKKGRNLEDWASQVFGAQNIQPMDVIEIGHAVKGVWRPSLRFEDEISQALMVTSHEMRLAEQSLRLLLERLDEILLYIEPNAMALNTYSHKTRELLILASTEVENYWQSYITIAGSPPPQNGHVYNTRDYVKLADKLFLRDYEFKFKAYPHIPVIAPFATWNTNNPTTSLTWYNAYNQTKHDRSTHFAEAKLEYCFSAVVACLVLQCVKFSPFPMFTGNSVFSSLINQHFDGRLIACSPKTCYIPLLNLQPNTKEELLTFNPRDYEALQPFVIDALVL